jgi:hypothetical protein
MRVMCARASATGAGLGMGLEIWLCQLPQQQLI